MHIDIPYPGCYMAAIHVDDTQTPTYTIISLGDITSFDEDRFETYSTYMRDQLKMLTQRVNGN